MQEVCGLPSIAIRSSRGKYHVCFSHTEKKKKASSPQHNAHFFRRWVIKNAFHCTRQELCTCNTVKNPKVLQKSLLHTLFYFWTAFPSGYRFHSTFFHIIFDKTWHVLAFYHWIDCGCPTCLFLIKNREPYGLPRQQRKCQLFTCYAAQISHFHSLEIHLRALLQCRRACTEPHYFLFKYCGHLQPEKRSYMARNLRQTVGSGVSKCALQLLQSL